MSAYENWRVEVALHSQPDDPLPVYDLDLTPFVDGAVTTGHGRPSERQSAEPGNLSLVLNNADHRFTPGNTSSPYYPYWKQARRIRVRETIGYRSFTHFTGWLELPDIADWAESGDQTIIVTAVDRMTRLERSRTFITTLAEHILYTGGAALKGFWSLSDPAGSSTAAEATGGLGSLSLEGHTLGTAASPTSGLVTFAAVTGPSGDDGSYVRFDPIVVTATTVFSARLVLRDLGAISMTSNDYVTIAAWQMLSATYTGSYQTLLLRDNAGVNSLQIGYSSSDTCWQLVATTAAGPAVVNGPTPTFGGWQLVAARINNITGAVDFWVDSETATGSTGGASTGTMDIVIVDNGSPPQAAGHLQIYAGASAVFDRITFDAQRRAANTGLAGQTTGQRVATLAAYAGVPSGELVLDAGTAAMGHATLAGTHAIDGMRVAETTEQGVLLAAGSGRLVFQDRGRRYNL